METIQTAISKLKCQFSSELKDQYDVINYSIEPCNNLKFKSFNEIKLELFFLENLDFLELLPFQLKKVMTGNYTNLLVKKDYKLLSIKVELEEPVQITNVINNYINTNNDEWETTEF